MISHKCICHVDRPDEATQQPKHNVDLMLAQRRRRWANNKPTLGQRLEIELQWERIASCVNSATLIGARSALFMKELAARDPVRN